MNFETLLSEHGLAVFLLVGTLLGVYKIVITLGKKAIEVYEENLSLQRAAQEKKDLEFLKSVGEISQIIKTGDDRHELAHKILGEKIEKGHEIIGNKLDKVIKYQIGKQSK